MTDQPQTGLLDSAAEAAQPAPETPLATVQPQSLPTRQEPPTEGPGAILAAIVQLAKDPTVDVAKLDALMNMQERMEDRQDEADFNEAMSLAQAEMQPIIRDADNKQTNSKYATLLAIDAIVRPVYTKYGFNVRHEQESKDSRIFITCVVSRRRHSIRATLDAPADTLGPKGAPVKTELHGIGSTVTYLRNKTECMAFNLVLRNPGEDDDGNRAGARYVNDEQARALFLKLAEAGAAPDSFLPKHTNYKAETVDDVMEVDYVRIMNLLESILTARKAKETPA